MLQAFAILQKTRANIKKSVADLSLEQLNKIPAGFNNNIIWHVAHVVATQQRLVYGLSGLNFFAPAWIVENYKKGTIPEGPLNQEQVDEVMAFLDSAPQQTMQDIMDAKFENFKRYPTSFGIVLDSLDKAVAFNNVHEAMHLGNIISMKKLV